MPPIRPHRPEEQEDYLATLSLGFIRYSDLQQMAVPSSADLVVRPSDATLLLLILSAQQCVISSRTTIPSQE